MKWHSALALNRGSGERSTPLARKTVPRPKWQTSMAFQPLEKKGFTEDAACRQITLDPNNHIFYPIRGSYRRLDLVYDRTYQARNICHSCPVRQECLDWALKNEQNHGVWGGIPEEMRNYYVKHELTLEAMLEEDERQSAESERRKQAHDAKK